MNPLHSKLVWSLALAISCGALACSSGQTIVMSNCGRGTTLVDGRCEPTDTSADAVAADDSSFDDATVAEDAAVLPPDSSLPDTSLPDSSVLDSPPADTSSRETMIDTGVDAATDSAAETLGPDACPPDLAIDCSGQCGGLPALNCSKVSCFVPSGTINYPQYTIDNVSKLPMVIRTPDHPGIDPKCQPRCGKGNTTYGIAFAINVFPDPKVGIRVTVPPPWRIYKYTPYFPHCISNIASDDFGNCFFDPVAAGRYQWVVATTDPNASAQNITIENLGPDDVRCVP